MYNKELIKWKVCRATVPCLPTGLTCCAVFAALTSGWIQHNDGGVNFTSASEQNNYFWQLLIYWASDDSFCFGVCLGTRRDAEKVAKLAKFRPTLLCQRGSLDQELTIIKMKLFFGLFNSVLFIIFWAFVLLFHPKDLLKLRRYPQTSITEKSVLSGAVTTCTPCPSSHEHLLLAMVLDFVFLPQSVSSLYTVQECLSKLHWNTRPA